MSPTTDLGAGPLWRLSRVEIRKSFDTRSGRWFTWAILTLALLVMLLQALVVAEGVQDLAVLATVSSSIIGVFAPIIPIMLVAQEWSQRTALTTFTLEPRRWRILLAKLVASTLIVLGVLVVAFVIAVAGALLARYARGIEVSWDVGAGLLRNVFVANLIVAVLGFALAALMRHTPAAIVGYFLYILVLPVVFELAGAYLAWFGDIRPWIDFAAAQEPLLSAGGASARQWAHLAVSSTIWVLVPLAAGCWRLGRTEVR